MIKICENPDCSKEYFTKRKKQKCCSNLCVHRVRTLNSLEIIICQNKQCNKNFSAKKTDHRKYCSSSCAAIVNNVITPKRSVEGSCYICSIPISTTTKYCEQHKNHNYSTHYISTLICKFEECNKEFDTFLMYKKFCSSFCRKKYFTKLYSKETSICQCGNKCGINKQKCHDCVLEEIREHKINSWKNGTWAGGSERHLSKIIREYLLELYNFSCSVCGFNEKHPIDNAPVVEIDHIDGNGANHRPENLTVLCPNHHALTPTYRNRNHGNGRKVYYIRIAKR